MPLSTHTQIPTAVNSHSNPYRCHPPLNSPTAVKSHSNHYCCHPPLKSPTAVNPHSGILAGELSQRHTARPMPWVRFTFLRLFPCCCCCAVTNTVTPPTAADDGEYWRRRATVQSVRLLVLTLGVAYLSITAKSDGMLLEYLMKGGCIWWQVRCRQGRVG